MVVDVGNVLAGGKKSDGEGNMGTLETWGEVIEDWKGLKSF